MISGLVDYIHAPTDENGAEKALYSGAKNFWGTTRAGRKAEMISLASESIQSKMPVTHWIMSWQENEQPSREQIEDAVDVFLERMGLVGHQVMYALHGNTANLHLHIVVNRTNPDTLKVIQPHRGFDIEEAHRIVALLQHRQGWAAENSARYTVNEKGEIVRSPRKGTVRPKEKAEAVESATGEKSAQRIAQERGHGVIKNAKSWRELHEGLAKAGLRLEKKGSGAILFVGEIAVKASSVDRAFGLGKLCKRLGEFEAGEYEPDMPTPEPEPVSELARAEWEEYRRLRERRATERGETRTRQREQLRRVMGEQREYRRKALASLAPHGVSVLNIARHCLAAQMREAMCQRRAELPKPEQPLPRFRTWLAGQNPRLAALFKYRRRLTSGMNAERREFPKLEGLQSPYRAYRRLIMEKVPEPMDESRRDAMIALWMRSAGYTRPETANEMHRQARPRRSASESRDWIAYARRTVWYAYGAAGDIDIAAARPSPEQIQAFHQEAERLERELAAKERERAEETEREPKATEAPRLRMR